MSIFVPIIILVLGIASAIALALFIPGVKSRLRMVTLTVGVGLVLIIETIATAQLLTQHQANVLTLSEQVPPIQTAHLQLTAETGPQVTGSTEEQALEQADAPAVRAVPTTLTTALADEESLAAPSATEQPSTAVPVTRTVASADTDTPLDIAQRLAKAEEALHSGELSAVADLGNGTKTQAVVRFDLGTGPRDARFHVLTTYRSAASSQVIEYITIGDKHWQRIDDGDWTQLASGHGAMTNIQAYLPQARRATQAVTYDSGHLQWNDVLLGSDVGVNLDPVTGVPAAMERRAQTTGLLFDVVYAGWNTAVNIPVPILP